MKRLVRTLLALVLAAVTLPVAPVSALPLPWERPVGGIRPAPATRANSSLQEVSPPAPVQQLQAALARRQPVVEILSPRNDTVLPAGPWPLELRLHDWPLVDGGALGVGPHLVVQLDQEPPRIWTRSEGIMPALSPGSHRLTVYAAQPWGEARKNPGAVQQIRLHRTAANPLTLPSPGSPQLLAVSPSGPAGGEPLLLDWLLLDAPLQEVGGRGVQWRLRASINDEDVLLDQQSPLWLRGWRPGANTLRLELLDARGAPLNPPFNSLVQEVDLSPSAPTPRWRGGALSASELAILLGETLPPPAPEREPGPAVAQPPAIAPVPAEPQTTVRNAPTRAIPPDDAPAAVDQQTLPSPEQPVRPRPEPAADPRPADGPNSRPGPPGSSDASVPLASSEAVPETRAAPSDGDNRETRAGPEEPGPDPGTPAADPGFQDDDGPSRSPVLSAGAPPSADVPAASLATPGSGLSEEHDPARAVAPAAGPAALNRRPDGDDDATLLRTPAQNSMTAPPDPSAPSPAPPTPQALQPGPSLNDDGEGRIRPSTALEGRARDLVNDDGTLRRLERGGPLAGLLERLQR